MMIVWHLKASSESFAGKFVCNIICNTFWKPLQAVLLNVFQTNKWTEKSPWWNAEKKGPKLSTSKRPEIYWLEWMTTSAMIISAGRFPRHAMLISMLSAFMKQTLGSLDLLQCSFTHGLYRIDGQNRDSVIMSSWSVGLKSLSLKSFCLIIWPLGLFFKSQMSRVLVAWPESLPLKLLSWKRVGDFVRNVIIT